MALDQFTNNAVVDGLISGSPTPLTDSVTVTLVEGLSMEKTADRASWAVDELTYTITIVNGSGVTYENVTVTDKLGMTENNLAKVVLVPDSVKLDDDDVNYTYNETTDELVIAPNPQLDIETGRTVVITFRVEKETP